MCIIIPFFPIQMSYIAVILKRHAIYYYYIQVWTQKCAVQKARVDVNISHY